LECLNYHLTAEKPALVYALAAAAAVVAVAVAAATAAAAAAAVVVAAAAAAAAWQGRDRGKKDEAAMPMYARGMDTKEGYVLPGDAHLSLRCWTPSLIHG
jgi:hypothetical protein